MSHMVGREHSEHVCRPVYIDHNGIKQPIISYNTPNHYKGGYITQKETIVERVYAPMVTEYEHSPPSHVHTPMKTVHTPRTKEYQHSSPRKVDPYKDYGANDHKWRRPSSPVYDRPQEVEEFITKVQTEVFPPTRTTPLSGTYWRNTTNPTKPTGYGGDHKKFSNNNEKDDDNYRRIDHNHVTNPIANNVGGFARPTSRPLSGATNDVDEAVGFLKETLVKSSPFTANSPPPRYSEPLVSGFPNRETYVETIDSREATRRYARPHIKTGDYAYTGTINSTDAMKKYGGTYVP